MAQSIRNTICTINEALSAVFQGAKFYGVATSVDRDGKMQPSVDELPVGIDDSYAMQMYHKITSATFTYTPAYGDDSNAVNKFLMSAFIFNNEKKTKLKADEIAMILQSYFYNIDINRVTILPLSFILNTAAIWAAEYRGVDFPLPEYTSLMQFNYSVEITFKGGCVDLCPENFTTCKTN